MKKRIKILSVFICLILISSIIVSCSNFNQVKRVSKNLSAYEFDISINDETKVVDVIQKVKVINNYDVSLNTICFNVYARAFREGALVKPYTTLNEGKCFPNGVNYGDIEFESVKVNSKDTEFRFIGEDSNALEIKLNDELEAGSHVFVEFKFCLKLSENTHRLGFFNDSINLGNWFPILAVFEKGEYVINPYYSTGDPFYSDIANYKATINYSNDYYLSATGAFTISKVL